jgi:hypothetical protein
MNILPNSVTFGHDTAGGGPLTIIVLLVAALAFSQSPAQTSGGRIFGSVTVEGTDKPIPEAQVWLLAITELAPGFPQIKPFVSSIGTKSDEGGHFVFEGIAPGTYLLNATARRPIGARYPGDGFVRPPSYSPFTIQMAAGQSLDGLDFRCPVGERHGGCSNVLSRSRHSVSRVDHNPRGWRRRGQLRGHCSDCPSLSYFRYRG